MPSEVRLVDWLRSRPDCTLEDGLSAAELDRAEQVADARIPPPWRAVLAQVHPTGPRWPDWRLRDDSAATMAATSLDGLLFDVEHNGFWWPSWGARPASARERDRIAAAAVAQVTRPWPIRGHWYADGLDPHPVWSIVQTDLYLVAAALTDLPDTPSGPENTTRVVPSAMPTADSFWTQLFTAQSRGPERSP